jgi:hypothetical protein
MALTSPVRAARPSAKRPWSLRERLDEREIAELITAYRNGDTATSLATTHGVSLSSVKRLLYTAGVRRTPSTRGSTKATPTTTYPQPAHARAFTARSAAKECVFLIGTCCC